MKKLISSNTQSSWGDEKASGLLDLARKWSIHLISFFIKKQYYSLQALCNAHVTFSVPTISHALL